MTTRIESMTESRHAERLMTGAVVAGTVALMFVTMGRAVILLSSILVVSYALWLTRASWPPRGRVLPALAVAVVVQCVHLAEEYRNGFFRVFPGVFGAKAWSAEQFLWFNMLWFIAFVLAGIGIARHWRPAYVVALFLAIGGGIANSVGHFALSTLARGYYPGLYTAPLALVSGLFLASRLLGSPRR